MVPAQKDFVNVEVRTLVIDPTTEAPVVILQVVDGSDLLPIWIGGFEAQSIAMAVEGFDPPRPMTHDLLKSVIETTGFQMVAVRIHSLKDRIFMASIRLESTDPVGDFLEIDARPSDAIALALRTQSPIEVCKQVMSRAQVEQQTVDEALRSLLDNLDPEDLGQYEM